MRTPPAPRGPAGRASGRGRNHPSSHRPPEQSEALTAGSPHDAVTETAASAIAPTTPAATTAKGTTTTAVPCAAVAPDRSLASRARPTGRAARPPRRRARWTRRSTNRSRVRPRRWSARRSPGRRFRAPRPSSERRCRRGSAAPTGCRRAPAWDDRAPRRATIGRMPPQPVGPVRAWSRGRAAAVPAWRPTRGSMHRRSRARSRRVGLRRRTRRAAVARRRCAPARKQAYHSATMVSASSKANGMRTASDGSSHGEVAMMNAAPSQFGSGDAVGRHAAQRRREPRRASFGHRQHLAERREVGVFPGVASEDPRQHIGRAQQQQCHARQTGAPRRWSRGPGSVPCSRARSCPSRCAGPLGPNGLAPAKKKAAEAAFCGARRAAHFLRPTRANLLRNFSTRPPRLSMHFCVPV